MSDLEASKTATTPRVSVLYPSLTQSEISKIMQFVAEQDRERRLTVGRMRYMMSYWIRRGSDRNDHPFSKATAEMARAHVSTLIREITRLRESLWAIANNRPTVTPAQTGNDDVDMAYNLQATALEALKEPELGPPDSVCQRFNVLDKEESHNA